MTIPDWVVCTCRNFFAQFVFWKPQVQIKVSAESVSPEASLLGVQAATLPVCPSGPFPCALAPGAPRLLLRTLAAPSWPRCTLTTSIKALSPNGVTLGIRASAREFRGDTIQSMTVCDCSTVRGWGGPLGPSFQPFPDRGCR